MKIKRSKQHLPKTLLIMGRELFKECSTRKEGEIAREALHQLLQKNEILEIDFSDLILSVSFADECIGMLAETLGKEAFKKRLILKNASPPNKALLVHVIARRLSHHSG